ncbi:MAG TPA: pseudouridine synthase [Gemmatimonadota bacterium]|nr:pseudouridine synthase [Gemmatimonadota bacterium]
MAIRLSRFLAQAGVASRRKAEDLISAGLVAIDGRVVTDLATRVEPDADGVTLRGERVRPRVAGSGDTAAVLALHKPTGYLTARSDPAGRPTVYDLVPEPAGTRLIYVGRLDRDTEGLLLFTTHGELAHRLMHPRWGVERRYVADARGELDEAALARGAREGMELAEGRTGLFRARILERRGSGRGALRRVELVLTEGRKREVRRIVKACGGRVERLLRTRYADVDLGDLAPGRWRRLEPAEVRRLLARVGLAGAEDPK